MRSSPRVVLAALLLTASALLPGCLSSSELECAAGTVRCGDTCVSTQTDSNNCGSCGSACSGGNVCVAGACVCGTGQTVCNGICTTTATDPRNCGACGRSCGSLEICDQGVCFDCNSQPGMCQRASIVAGCIDGASGGLRQVQDARATGLTIGAMIDPPSASFPDALGVLGGALLYADHDSSSLFEIPIADLSVASAERLPLVGGSTGSKAGTTQLYVETPDGGTGPSRIYAMTSSVNALRIFDGPPAVDAEQLLDGGVGQLGLTAAGGAAFDPGSFPEPFAKVGDEVFVPLNATGKVLRVDISNPASAQVKETFDLQPLIAALPGGGTIADGGVFSPSPTQAIARNGKVYVSMNVLRYHADFSGADYGPPLVARIDPTQSGSAAVSAIALDGSECQNVNWLASVPQGSASSPLLVSCAGARTYDSNSFVTAVAHTTLVLLDASDQRVTAWVPSTGAGQPPPSVGRAVPVNASVYVADETDSRLYVLDLGTNALVERVGNTPDGGTPPKLCPSYITDLAVVPLP